MLRLLKRRRAPSEAEHPPAAEVCPPSRPRPTRVSVVEYNAEEFGEWEVERIEGLGTPENGKIRWIDVQGLADAGAVQALCDSLGLHPLVAEDVLDTGERTKLDVFADHFFLVVDTFYYPDGDSELLSDQVSIIVFANLVVTFQEGCVDAFGPVRERLRADRGHLRARGADYLAYALLDTLVDRYFVTLEELGERIEALEDELAHKPDPESLRAIHRLRGDTALVRKSVWPLRAVLNALVRGESSLVQAPTTIYLRDVYDHTVEIIETTETFREVLSTMLDIYLSSVSNRLNEIMKFLTIIATVFIPLTFIVGIYGMNFRYMPELEWPWGYPMVWAVMVTAAMWMLYYFRKKRWL
ncbi:MAG: magnesium/cobalt transporter CorA [Armatimonadetes bacterium]|nr:magnesium/cobalt transporter CorA [Armatimonadota bacterium]